MSFKLVRWCGFCSLVWSCYRYFSILLFFAIPVFTLFLSHSTPYGEWRCLKFHGRVFQVYERLVIAWFLDCLDFLVISVLRWNIVEAPTVTAYLRKQMVCWEPRKGYKTCKLYASFPPSLRSPTITDTTMPITLSDSRNTDTKPLVSSISLNPSAKSQTNCL